MVPYGPDDRIKVNPPSYVVAGLADNKAVDQDAVFVSEAMARDYMNTMVKQNPNKAGEIHVISAFEAEIN